MSRFRPVALCLVVLSVLIASTFCFAAAADRVTGPIVATQITRIPGSVPVQARPEFDQGLVESSMRLDYITLLTTPSAAQQRALKQLLADQQDPHSPSYHKWLTPEQYADRFGLSSSDINKITAWLQSQGFSIVKVANGRNFVVFSGTVAQVESAFQTEVHRFNADGQLRFSIINPPAIPTALSGIVVGFRGLSNFPAKSQAVRAKPDYTLASGGPFFLAPGDIATMYDLDPLYTAGIDGTGQKIAVIGQTDVYLADIADFRSGFGLSAISCTTSGTNVITACDTANFKYVLVNADPGAPNAFGDDLAEADIDIEWSGATARNAKIIYVNAPSLTGSGVYDALQDAIDNNRAPVITMSYTAPCEFAEIGYYQADEAELQKANTFGITFLNSSGDTGAAECDYGANIAVDGYAVGYPASSQYTTGVGGTLIPQSEYTTTYWGATNATDGGSALSYIPEHAWNDAQEIGAFCAANLTNSFCQGGAGTGNPITNWQTAQADIGILGGGGGVSNCVTTVDGTPNTACNSGFPRPSWQAGLSNSSVDPGGIGELNTTAVRFSPDVSLLASVYWPGYIVCTAESELGFSGTASSCAPGGPTGIQNNLNNFGYTFGGTSISSPIFAGIVALLNQYTGATGGLGNINPTLYTLAATPSNGAFHSVHTGNIGAYCTAGQPSGQPAALRCPSSGSNPGFLGFDASNFDSTTGYNLATGLGSVDANKLFIAWVAAGLSATTTTLTSSLNPSTGGTAVTFTATVATAGTNPPTGSVSFNDGSNVLGTGTLATVSGAQVATFTTSSLTVGSHSITAVYAGDTNNDISTSAVLTQTVNGDSTTTVVVSNHNPANLGVSVTFTATVATTGTHAATGTVTFKDGSTSIGTGTLATVSGAQVATLTTSSLAVGSHSITAVYGGDTNNAGSTSSVLTETINADATSTTVVSSANPAILAASVTFTATVTTTGTHAATGTVTFNDGSTALGTGTLAAVSGNQVATFTTSSLAVGSHSITAVYGGDANNAGSTSSTLTQTITAPVFTISSQPGTPAAVLAGIPTTTTFTITPAATTTMPITFSCPVPDATFTCSAPTIAAGASGPQTVTVTITTSGPNTAGGNNTIRRHADNRSPWLPLTLPLAGIVFAGIAGRKLSKYSVAASFCLALALLGLMLACGGSSAPISVTATSSASSLYPQNTGWTNSTANLTATVANDSSNKGVSWAVSTANGGTIVATDTTHATYTPPTIAAGLPSSVTITATSVADTSKSGTTSIALKPATVPGPYTFTVTGTEGPTTHTTNSFTLTVN